MIGHTNRFCVYGHYTSDTGELFYVGKGTEFRASQFGVTNRNSYWINVKEKHGVKVEILKKNLTEQEAFQYEKELIQQHRPRCNFTDGGDGPSGAIRTPEMRKRIGDFRRGKILPESQKQNIGAGLKKAYEEGRKASVAGNKLSKERRDKIAIGQGMKPFKVYKIETNEFMGEWTNAAECGRMLGINKNSSWMCAIGKISATKGFRFERSQ